MIIFDEPVMFGRLIKRYKRFFMDVKLPSSEVVVAHTPNTGSMAGLLHPGNRVLLTQSSDEKRKLKFTAQAIEIDGHFVGINTHLPNRLVKESLHHPLFLDLKSYRSVKTEKAFGKDLRSRVDFYFSEDDQKRAPTYLEVKNVTMRVLDQAQFPDTISKRAQKHLDDLVYVRSEGYNACLLFIVQRTDCISFSPAKAVDEIYAEKLFEAKNHGVTMRALTAAIDAKGLALKDEIPIVF